MPTTFASRFAITVKGSSGSFFLTSSTAFVRRMCRAVGVTVVWDWGCPWLNTWLNCMAERLERAAKEPAAARHSLSRCRAGIPNRASQASGRPDDHARIPMTKAPTAPVNNRTPSGAVKRRPQEAFFSKAMTAPSTIIAGAAAGHAIRAVPA